jgi:glycosyltransferase involved in cell wall biosynthesis
VTDPRDDVRGGTEIRVLHVLEALEGGTARHLADVVRHTPDVRHEVAVPQTRAGWATDEHAVGRMKHAGALVHFVDMRRNPVDPRNAAAAAALRRLIARRRPTLVHGHSSVGGALARIAAWRAPVARVYTPNGLATSPVALRVERLLGRWTDHLIAVSESEAELALQVRLVPPQRLSVIPNGVGPEGEDGSAIDLRRQLGISAPAPLVGSVARLVPQKAPEVFVRACALIARRVRNAEFLLVGTGPLQWLVDEEVQRANLGRRWHQIPNLPDAKRALGQLDVFVLLSRFEGCPYTPLEAMQAGTPVVLSRVVGNRDIVEPDVSGLAVPAEDPGAAAQAVVRILTDGSLAAALVAGGRRRVATHFDVRAMGLALRDLYRQVASDVGAPT